MAVSRSTNTVIYFNFNIFIISTLVYPYAKKTIEVAVLSVTSKTFWYKGFFAETSQKSGIYALYYLFYCVFSILLGLIYILLLPLKKSRVLG